MSKRSKARRTRLVGSMLYVCSRSALRPVGLGRQGESVSGTGPTIIDGQMTESAFSRCMVKSLPEVEACNDSDDEKDDARLRDTFRGDTARNVFRLDCWRCTVANPTRSSAEDETGEESAGDDARNSSVSEVGPLPTDAAKLLDISGSETKA